MWDVVGFGAGSIDSVYRLPAWPEPRGPANKLRFESHAVRCGGQVATALATCASLGRRAAYLGPVGDDDGGRRILEELARRAVDVAGVLVKPAATQHAVILTAAGSEERIVLWQRDEGLACAPDELDPALVASTRVLHVDDVDPPAARRLAEHASARNVAVTSDIDRLEESTIGLVAAVSIPILAEHVPPALTGKDDPERALRQLRRASHRMLCVTLGERGAMLLVGDRLYHQPAYRVEVVDSTGAGDVFRGAFIDALLRGDDPGAMLRWANAAAAVSCTRAGAMSGVPTVAEVRHMVRTGVLRPT